MTRHNSRNSFRAVERDARRCYALFQSGESVGIIAKHLNRSVRTIMRYIERAERERGDLHGTEKGFFSSCSSTTSCQTWYLRSDGGMMTNTNTSPGTTRDRFASREEEALAVPMLLAPANGAVGAQSTLMMGRRMKSAMMLRLPPDKLDTLCDCGSPISVFSFCAVVLPQHGMLVCCVQCARASAESSHRRHLRMNRTRALAWIMSCGMKHQALCALCEDPSQPLGVLDDWQLCHRDARARCGERSVQNLFPGHASCNVEQHTRSLEEANPSSDGIQYAMNIEEAKACYENVV